MVMVWNRLQHDNVGRLSGLEYLRALLNEEEVRRTGNTLWIMASSSSAERNVTWLKQQGIEIPDGNVYVAPVYGKQMEDQALLERLALLRPSHIIVTLGGGTQERLGFYLKRNLSYLPAMHCIGAAIAFLSGDQVRIPVWVDKMYLGWLLRCLSDPVSFVPRYWKSRPLPGLLKRYGHEMPPLQ